MLASVSGRGMVITVEKSEKGKERMLRELI